METSKTSTGEQLNDLTLFAVDTPVSPSPQQAKEKEQTTHDTSGPGSEMPLAHYDQSTQSWRMSEDISLWGEYKSLESLPKSGMTRNGVLYQQPEWVRPIDATELLLWPTPTTQEVEHPQAELTATGRRKSKNGKTSHSLGLADAVKMWPTPTVDDSKNVTRQSGSFQSLTREVVKWPTPMAVGAGGSGHWNMVEKMYLDNQISYEDKMALQAGNGGKLNPTWVEWLMGFPIGWTDLED